LEAAARERAQRLLGCRSTCSASAIDGYFTRVNPAFEQTLGYTSAELTSRPFVEFAHPDDRELTAEAFASQKRGNELIGLENRYICSDGSVRWLQWTARALPEEGFACAVARDIERRQRGGVRCAPLQRRRRCLASRFSRSPRRQPGGDVAAVFRYAPDREATLVGGWSIPGIAIPIGSRFDVTGTGVGVRVLDTQRPARMERFEGPPGSMAAFFSSCGTRRGVGAPITVEGQLWGVLVIASTDRDRLPAGSELRTAQFTDLLATAVANADLAALQRATYDGGDGCAAPRPNAVFAGVAEGRRLFVDRATR
jgi:PAS domain S-box-containing protein